MRDLLGGGGRTPDLEFASADDPGLLGPDSVAIIGRRLGAIDVPETASELAEWIAGVPDLEMTREAREAVRFVVLPPLPPPVLPAYLVLAAKPSARPRLPCSKPRSQRR